MIKPVREKEEIANCTVNIEPGIRKTNVLFYRSPKKKTERKKLQFADSICVSFFRALMLRLNNAKSSVEFYVIKIVQNVHFSSIVFSEGSNFSRMIN